jgi:predicted enzyme related to lactoylglutathione lyase
MSITNALASVAVKDLSSAVQWYQRLFGRPPDSEQPEVAGWQFKQGGWLQIYKNAERAGYGSLTLAVTSLDEQIADLRKRGIDTGRQMITANGRVVMIKDQEGNSIAFVETIEQSIDQNVRRLEGLAD